MSAPPLPSAEEAAALLGIDDLNEEAAETPAALPSGFRAVRDFMAAPAAPLATRLVAELLPLYPQGAALGELQAHVGASDAEMQAAMALLARWNAVTVAGDAVRVDRSPGGAHAMLTPVSFQKDRRSEPRLSEPYVPGRRSSGYWSDAEIDIVRQHYEKRGAAYCLSLLPGRTISGVYGQAGQLGLKQAGRRERSVPVGTAYDDQIKERWPFLSGRGAVAALAAELGLRRHTVSQQALALGLTLPHRKEPPWTPAEEELLRRAPVNNPDAAVKFFAAHGFKRSPSAITVRCKRLGVSRRRQDVFSARAAARILGVDDKTVTIWCIKGRITASRRGTRRLPQQGGDLWTIQPADLRRFILDQLDVIDIRKVDKFAFVALLTETGATADPVEPAECGTSRARRGVGQLSFAPIGYRTANATQCRRRRGWLSGPPPRPARDVPPDPAEADRVGRRRQMRQAAEAS